MNIQNKLKTKAWFHAFRLRTLPLASSGVILGALLAYNNGQINIPISILTLITALLLQILSNLANDYGDYVKGTDNSERVGPERAVQSGVISKNEMKNAIIGSSILSLISGLTLLIISFLHMEWKVYLPYFLGLLVIGLLAIWAAIQYTVGRKAYGYIGLGDLFVLIFFGWVSVAGTYFLNTHSLDYHIFLPATTIGLFSTAVINLNNMRDFINDQKSNKITLAIILGQQNAKLYHLCLIVGGFAAMSLYTMSNFISSWQYLYLIMLIPMFIDLFKISINTTPAKLDPFLKKQAINTFLFVIIYGIGIFLS